MLGGVGHGHVANAVAAGESVGGEGYIGRALQIKDEAAGHKQQRDKEQAANEGLATGSESHSLCFVEEHCAKAVDALPDVGGAGRALRERRLLVDG